MPVQWSHRGQILVLLWAGAMQISAFAASFEGYAGTTGVVPAYSGSVTAQACAVNSALSECTNGFGAAQSTGMGNQASALIIPGGNSQLSLSASNPQSNLNAFTVLTQIWEDVVSPGFLTFSVQGKLQFESGDDTPFVRHRSTFRSDSQLVQQDSAGNFLQTEGLVFAAGLWNSTDTPASGRFEIDSYSGRMMLLGGANVSGYFVLIDERFLDGEVSTTQLLLYEFVNGNVTYSQNSLGLNLPVAGQTASFDLQIPMSFTKSVNSFDPTITLDQRLIEQQYASLEVITPEPAAIHMLGAGLLALGWFGRRRS